MIRWTEETRDRLRHALQDRLLAVGTVAPDVLGIEVDPKSHELRVDYRWPDPDPATIAQDVQAAIRAALMDVQTDLERAQK